MRAVRVARRQVESFPNVIAEEVHDDQRGGEQIYAEGRAAGWPRRRREACGQPGA